MVYEFPTNRQLRINGCVTRELLANPDCFDSSGEPCLIVMKDGNTTDLTVGRCAGLEAYLCDELGVESRELAIYNYNKQSGPFSAKGDSGSLIFDGMGKMVGILHSGMPTSSHVTYATPAWWAIEQLKSQVSACRLRPQCLLNTNTIVGHLLSHLLPPSYLPLCPSTFFLSAIVFVFWVHPPSLTVFSRFFLLFVQTRVPAVDSLFSFVPFFRLILSCLL